MQAAKLDLKIHKNTPYGTVGTVNNTNIGTETCIQTHMIRYALYTRAHMDFVL